LVSRRRQLNVTHATLLRLSQGATLIASLAIITNLPATAIQTSSATLNGKVLTNGGSLTTITIFYGPADGAANPTAWSYNTTLGTEIGAFSLTVSGLASNSTYFLTCRGVNSS